MSISVSEFNLLKLVDGQDVFAVAVMQRLLAEASWMNQKDLLQILNSIIRQTFPNANKSTVTMSVQ